MKNLKKAHSGERLVTWLLREFTVVYKSQCKNKTTNNFQVIDNTYQLEPAAKFQCGPVERIIKDVLIGNLHGTLCEMKAV